MPTHLRPNYPTITQNKVSAMEIIRKFWVSTDSSLSVHIKRNFLLNVLFFLADLNVKQLLSQLRWEVRCPNSSYQSRVYPDSEASIAAKIQHHSRKAVTVKSWSVRLCRNVIKLECRSIPRSPYYRVCRQWVHPLRATLCQEATKPLTTCIKPSPGPSQRRKSSSRFSRECSTRTRQWRRLSRTVLRPTLFRAFCWACKGTEQLTIVLIIGLVTRTQL
jgi:hypothetical protein